MDKFASPPEGDAAIITLTEIKKSKRIPCIMHQNSEGESKTDKKLHTVNLWRRIMRTRTDKTYDSALV